MKRRALGILSVLAGMSHGCVSPPGDLPPAPPSQLSQFMLDAVTPIGRVGQTDETGAVLRGLVTAGGGAYYRLAVEIRPIQVSFTNVPTVVSGAVRYGTPAEVIVPLWKTKHHWQAWGINDTGPGRAVSFPLSEPNAEGESDIDAIYSGTIYYVSADGDDDAGVPDDPTKPYRSPLGAGSGAYAAIPADITGGRGDHVIQFMDGFTYGQAVMTPKTTDATHRIILRAAAGTTPTMDADSRADGSTGTEPILRIMADNVVVSGMHFTNTNADNSLSAGNEVMVHLEGSYSVIDANYFDGNGRVPTTTDTFLLICDNARDNEVSGNRFDYSGGKSLIHITASCGGGSPGRQIIRNNALSRFGNNPQAICAAINFGGSIGTFAGDSSIVENNTIYDNGGGCYGLLDTNSSVLTVRDNIFSMITGHRSAIGCNVNTGRSSGVAYHSIMFGNTSDVESGCPLGGWRLDTYTTDDPHFVDPLATPPDLHVQSTTGSRNNDTAIWTIDTLCSSAIDRADPSGDFDREPSPNGDRRNLGAYGNTLEAARSCGHEFPDGTAH